MTAKLPDEVEAKLLAKAEHLAGMYCGYGYFSAAKEAIYAELQDAAVVAVEHERQRLLGTSNPTEYRNVWEGRRLAEEKLAKAEAELTQLRTPGEPTTVEEHAAFIVNNRHAISSTWDFEQMVRKEITQAVTEAVTIREACLAQFYEKDTAQRVREAVAAERRRTDNWKYSCEHERAQLAEANRRHAAELAQKEADFDRLNEVRLRQADDLRRKLFEFSKELREARQAAFTEAIRALGSWPSSQEIIRQLAAAEKPAPESIELHPQPEMVDRQRRILDKMDRMGIPTDGLEDESFHASQWTVSPYPCAHPPRREGKLKRNCGGVVTRTEENDES